MPINTSGGINTYAQVDLSGYLPLAGGVMTGDIDLNGNDIILDVDGDSYIDTGTADDRTIIYEGGTIALQIATTSIYGQASNFWGIMNELATATNPTFIPSRDYPGYGLGGSPASGYISLISNDKEMIRLTESTAGNSINMQAPVTYVGHQFTENFLWAGAIYGTVWDLTNVTGAGTNVIKAGAGMGGVTLLTTGGTTGDYECTQTHDVFFSRMIAPCANIHVSLDTDLNGKQVKFGFSDNPMVEDGKYVMFYFDYSADNVNWWSHSADGVDASLAVGPTAGTSQKLRICLTTAGVATFFVDDVLVGTVTGAVSDDTAMYLFYGIETEANQAEAIEVDHIAASWGY